MAHVASSEKAAKGVELPESVGWKKSWQGTGTSTVHIAQADTELLELLYMFRGRADVLRFLGRCPFLVPLLLEAYIQIGGYFPLSPVFLEVVTDPEGAGENQLVMSIAGDFSSDEALAQLDEFDEDWWLDALGRTQGKLCIDVEFQ